MLNWYGDFSRHMAKTSQEDKQLNNRHDFNMVKSGFFKDRWGHAAKMLTRGSQKMFNLVSDTYANDLPLHHVDLQHLLGFVWD